MEASPAVSPTTPSDDPAAALPPGVPPEIKAAARSEVLTDAQERSALDWFLGATRPLQFFVDVQYDTPDGLLPLRVHLQQVDDARIKELDAENRTGDPPFQKLNVSDFNAALVAEAFVALEDPGSGVRKADEEIRGGAPALSLALKIRFKFQPGILEQLAERIQEKAGFGGDRVGTAQRSVVEVGKPS